MANIFKRLFLAVAISGILFLALRPDQADALPAFPGAEGSGANSLGGRGGRVIEVTTLSDGSFAGTFRDAVQQSGARTVVFRVGGTITLTSPLFITNPFLTIAGQTAPGGGILLKGNMISIGAPAHDMIIRYIRHRPGSAGGAGTEGGKGFEVVSYGASIYNVIVDHSSFGWQNDDNSTAYNNVDNITYQWNIFAEGGGPTGNGAQGKSFLVGTSPNAGTLLGNASYHHNFVSSSDSRNPIIAGDGPIEFVNNVVYNWGAFGTSIQNRGTGTRINFIGNFWKRGPSSSSSIYEVILGAAGGDAKLQPSGMLYTLDNRGPHRTSDSTGQFAIIGDYGPTGGTTPLSTSYQRFTPWAFPSPSIPISTSTATANVNFVLNSAGATLPVRDAVDTRLVAEYNAGTGNIGNDNVYPNIANGTPPTDTDHDGMPNSYETANGLDPNNAADRNNIHSSGYTWLEAYLNGTTTGSVVPAVNITTPVQNATVSGSSVSVAANASDDEGVLGVQFKLDGTNLGAEDTTSPYAVTWNTTLTGDGAHTLTAVARDADTNSTTSSAITVIVNNGNTTTLGDTTLLSQDDVSPPNRQHWTLFTLPAAGTVQSFSVFVVGGTGSIRMGVYDATGSGGLPGVLKAQTGGFAPATGWQTQAVQTPVVLTAGNYWISYIISGSLTLRASSTGGNSWNKDTTYGPLPTPNPAPTIPESWHWSFYALLGPANDITAPTVSITAPAAGNVTGASVAVNATAFDAVGVVGVQFKLDGANLGAEDLSFPYGIVWDSTLTTPGAHTLTAVARDAAANSTTSASVAVNVISPATEEQLCIAAGGTYVTGSISPPTLCVDEIDL